MAATPFGQIWSAWSSADGTLAGSLANSANSTTAAYSNSVASPNEILDTKFNLIFTYPNNAPTGVVTVTLLQQTQGGYQATTDPSLYAWTFTPTQNVNGQNVILGPIPGSDVINFKLNISNASGFTMSSISLYSATSQGAFN